MPWIRSDVERIGSCAARGDQRLVHSKDVWLRNPEHMSTKQWQEFAPVRTSQLRVARAWEVKEMAMRLWSYVRRGWAERMWKRWYSSATAHDSSPIKRVAPMIKRQGV